MSRSDRPTSSRPTSCVLLTTVLGLAACSARSDAATPGKLELQSPAFGSMASIPARYTCEGADVSPPLHWTGVPEGTQSLVLIVDDPDAPDPAHATRTWVHWLLYDIPPGTMGLPDGASASALASGAVHGHNDRNRNGYWMKTGP
jgi:Raf kinase inhibitor-like YbhB/YbcL family protein